MWPIALARIKRVIGLHAAAICTFAGALTSHNVPFVRRLAAEGDARRKHDEENAALLAAENRRLEALKAERNAEVEREKQARLAHSYPVCMCMHAAIPPASLLSARPQARAHLLSRTRLLLSIGGAESGRS